MIYKYYVDIAALGKFFNFSDLDEKYRKRERYGGGIITDFKEKDSYKPNFKLEYVDDAGRHMNQKEAFRQLSHRFHGKGSGKKKTEKRQKKVEEEQVLFYSESNKFLYDCQNLAVMFICYGFFFIINLLTQWFACDNFCST